MQNPYVIKDLYPEYINNSQNSIIREQIIQLKRKVDRRLNRYFTKEDIQMKGTLKDTQHH